MTSPAKSPSEPVGLERAVEDSGCVHRALASLGMDRGSVTVLRVGLVLAALTWAPLLVASLAEGFALGRPGAFLRDAGVHVRCLFALPVLVVAEHIVEARLRAALRYVDAAGLVDASERERVSALAARVRRLHGSVLAHLVIVLVVVAVSVGLLTDAPAVSTWVHPEPSASSAGALSIAGWIDVAWSGAVYRFFVARWLLQLGLWGFLLTQLARLPLRTSAVHHDGVGGIGPIVEAHEAFGWVVLAFSSALAARLAVQVQLMSGDPLAYRYALGAYCLIAPLVVLAPTFAFVVPLQRDRRRVLHQLAIAATDQARRFVREYATEGPRRPLAEGVDDITIGTDLSATYDRVYGMWRAPFRREHYGGLFAAAAIPMLGFYLATMPLDRVISSLRALMG